MRRIIVTYHESFSRRSYLTQGTRLSDFPEVLNDILQNPEYEIVHVSAAPEEWILKVHSPRHIDQVRMDPLCSTAWHSVGSVVTAMKAVAEGRAHRAFALIGAGGHHAGKDYFWGYCCFNDVVIGIRVLRDEGLARKFAIIDTDAHHGDGTRELVQNDPQVLHCCVCSRDYTSRDGTKVDLSAFRILSGCGTEKERNKAYASAIKDNFVPLIYSFAPDMLIWYFGFDTHRGDYGDLGLTMDAYLSIAKTLRETAVEVCNGRFVVVLGGGSRRDLASQLIPPIIKSL